MSEVSPPGPPHETWTRHARTSTRWSLGSIVVSTASTLVANLYLVARTPTRTYADIAVLTVVVLIVATAARLGSDRILVGEVAAYPAAQGRMRGGDVLGIPVVTALSAALLGAVPAIAVLVDRSISAPLTVTERALLSGWLVGECVRFVVAEAHRSLLRFSWASVTGVGLRSVLFLTFVVVADIAGTLDRQPILLAAACSSVAVLLVGLARLGGHYPWWRVHPIRAIRRSWRGHSGMLLTTLGATLIGAADVWVVGLFAVGDDIAAYAFAVTLVSGVAIFGSAVSSSLAPYLASGLRQGHLAATQALVVGQVRRNALLSLLAFLGLVAFAKPIAVQLGGPSYSGVTGYVLLLGLGQLTGAIVGPAGTLLTVSRRYGSIAAVTCAVAAVAVGLELVIGWSSGSALAVAAVSGAATGVLHLIAHAVADRSLGVRTGAWVRTLR